jgi:outer membrane protein assembly factor BamE (lipoprotein component of BamABCDE complex)
MKKNLVPIFTLAALSLLGGCVHTRNVGLMESSPAFDAEQLKISCTNQDKDTVRKLLGAPSFTNDSEDKWYYVGIAVQEMPFSSKIKSQNITQIEFCKENLVAQINTSSQVPSEVKILSNKTPTQLKKARAKNILTASIKKKRKPKVKKILNFY